jgi:hypothetical protein
MKIIGLLLVVIACHASAQDMPKCVPAPQIAAARERLAKLDEQLLDRQTRYLKTLDARSVSLAAVNQCKGEKSLIGDLADAFTLQQPKCNAEIDEYNMLDLQAENEKQVVSALTSMRDNLSTRIASASAVACR